MLPSQSDTGLGVFVSSDFVFTEAEERKRLRSGRFMKEVRGKSPSLSPSLLLLISFCFFVCVEGVSLNGVCCEIGRASCRERV